MFNQFNLAKNKMDKLNDEYEKLTILNKQNRKEIKESIHHKRREMMNRKKLSEKHFNSIRNK
jgi:hypothetical protein